VFYVQLAFPYTRFADGLVRLPPGSTTLKPPLYLDSDLNSALTRISDPSNSIHRSFIIGGASLYTEVLALSSSSQPTPPALVDRILLTRIISPAFEQCDVFMPDFLASQTSNDGSEWQRASHVGLQAWVEHQVPEGIQEENGIQYEFQMWVRR
jgi:dihydrofolate reductase